MGRKAPFRIRMVLAGAAIALARAANGVPMIDIPSTGIIQVGERLSVTVVSDTGAAYTAYLELRAEGLGRWDGPMLVYSSAGADASADDLTDDGEPGWWRLTAASGDPAQPIMPGNHFRIDYYASEMQAGVAEIWLRDSTGAPVQLLEVTQDIPEPGTGVILLGLAGLAVRRKL